VDKDNVVDTLNRIILSYAKARNPDYVDEHRDNYVK
jgi:hypothetical protein